MKATFLGTGTSQGVPVIGCECPSCRSDDPRDQRLRSSLLIQSEVSCVVVDTGPDFRQQMLKAGIKRLDAVVYTHEHRDHIAGLDDVRAYNFLQKRPMDIYGEKRVLDSLKVSFPYVFVKDKYPGVPAVMLHLLDMNAFSLGDIDFEPIRLFHAGMPVLGFRIRDFAYLVDANHIPEEEMEKLHGLNTVVIGALRKEEHHSHFTLDEAIALFNKLDAKYGYITHISHQMGLFSEYSKLLPEGMLPAYDGLELDI